MADVDSLPPWARAYIEYAGRVPGAADGRRWTQGGAPEALILAPRRVRIERLAVETGACIIGGATGACLAVPEVAGCGAAGAGAARLSMRRTHAGRARHVRASRIVRLCAGPPRPRAHGSAALTRPLRCSCREPGHQGAHC